MGRYPGTPGVYSLVLPEYLPGCPQSKYTRVPLQSIYPDILHSIYRFKPHSAYLGTPLSITRVPPGVNFQVPTKCIPWYSPDHIHPGTQQRISPAKHTNGLVATSTWMVAYSATGGGVCETRVREADRQSVLASWVLVCCFLTWHACPRSHGAARR